MDVSRREFVKISGLATAGLCIGTSVSSLGHFPYHKRSAQSNEKPGLTVKVIGVGSAGCNMNLSGNETIEEIDDAFCLLRDKSHKDVDLLLNTQIDEKGKTVVTLILANFEPSSRSLREVLAEVKKKRISLKGLRWWDSFLWKSLSARNTSISSRSANPYDPAKVSLPLLRIQNVSFECEAG